MSDDRAFHPINDTPAADARLVAQILDGDRPAAQRFVEEQYAAVYRHMFARTQDIDTAADLTQRTFARAWVALPTYEGRATLRSWLLRIARREHLQWLRR